MKIFVEADSIVRPQMSGVGHACLEIVRSLDKLMSNNDNLDVVLIVPFGAKRIVTKYGFKRVRVRSLWPGGRALNYMLARTSLPIPVDLWFGRGIYVFPNYKNWFVPFSSSITFVHDIAFKLYPETVQPKNRQYLEANFKRWIRRSDKVACISKSAGKDIENNFPETQEKIETIRLGVDPSVYFRRDEAEIARVLEKYDMPHDYFLFVGNLEPRKNLNALLDAYKLYADKHNDSPKALLLVGGDGWQNESIKVKIRNLQDKGYAIYQPSAYVEDENLPALYSGASALVHIAIYEGLGLSCLQAQACGTHVIAADIPVFRETLSGQNTTFVDNKKTAAVAAALADLKEHSEGLVDFTWDQTVKKLVAVSMGLEEKAR